MTKLTIKLIFLVATFQLGSVAWAVTPACTKDGTGAITDTTNCLVQPDQYFMTIYKIGLCTAKPIAPSANAAADLTSCTTVFENTAGDHVKVVKGTSSSLTGTITRPANGTYSYGYVIAAPKFEIKTTHTFSPARIAAGTALHNQGTSCWTTFGTSRVYGFNNLAQMIYPVECGNTVVANDFATQEINSFTDYVANPQPTNTMTFTTANGNGDAYLVDTTMKLGVGTNDTMGTVTRLLGVVPMPVTVTSATTVMSNSFNVTRGATVAMYTGAVGPAQVTGAIAVIGGGPFELLMTMQ